jgi:hypothetical protein
MRCPPKTKAGRLLRVLFLRVGSAPVGPTAHRTGKAVTSRRFPPPWSVEEQPACFVVRDHNGQQLAYIYYEEEPGRRSAAKLLSKERGTADRSEHRQAAGAFEPRFGVF